MSRNTDNGIVWFEPFAWFGAFLGALSFSHLVSKAYHIGFGPVLHDLLQVYETTLGGLTVVFEPLIHRVLAALRSLFDWDLHLFPHWKHVFILLTVYFSARYTSAFKKGQWGAAWLMVVVGLASALAAAVGAGVVPLNAVQEDVRRNIAAMTLFPTLGILSFDLAEIIWSSTVRIGEMREARGNPNLTPGSAFAGLLRNVAIRFGGALVIILAVIGASFLPIGLERSQSPGLTLLLVLSFLMGAYWLYQGVLTVPNRRQEGESWFSTYARIGSTRVGWAIVRYLLLGTTTVVVGWWLWDVHGIG